MQKFVMRIIIAMLWLFLLVHLCQAQVLNNDGGCQLVALLPFTDEREGPPESIREEGVEYYGYGQWPNSEALERATFSLMASAEMAAEHFNNRDTTIVPELADLGDCNIYFPDIVYHNTGYLRGWAVDSLLNMTFDHASEGNDGRELICGVIGPSHPRAHEGVSSITESASIPQVAYSTIDVRLSRKEDFPSFARILPSSQEYGFAIANYIERDVLERNFLAIIYEASDYGEQYEDPLEDAEDYFHNFYTITEGISEDELESIYEALQITKEDGYHSIILTTDRFAVLDEVANVADELGLIGEEYMWFIVGDMLPPAMLPYARFPVNSSADRLLRGAALFTNWDPFIYNGESDPFLMSWRAQNDTHMTRVQRLHPFRNNNTTTTDSTSSSSYYNGEEDYFQTQTPTEWASYLYDSVMAVGISACKAQASQTDHVAEMFDSNFQGASGHVQFIQDDDDYENGRDISGTMFGTYNVRPLDKIDEDGSRGYEIVLTHLYTNETQVPDSEVPVPGSWVEVEGTEFIYFDGTTNPPTTLKTIENYNYISKPIQAIGFTTMSIALVISIGTGMWVFNFRNNRLIKAAQPEFLYLLCLGASMVAFSLFFVSFDEDKGMTVPVLSAFCSVFLWLFIVGYNIMYCALFFKLWRLSKLLSMRRQVFKMSQVILPFGCVMGCVVLVLIVWQAVDPLTWDRKLINEDYDEPWISYGECNSVETGAVPFISVIGVIFAFNIVMTGAISFRLKDVQEELSESKWIFFGIFTQTQIWAIGIPLYIILDNVSRDASYLIQAAFTFVLSTSMVILVIWPKVYNWARVKYFPVARRRTKKSSNVESGVSATAPSRTETHRMETHRIEAAHRQEAREEEKEEEVLSAEVHVSSNAAST